MNEMQFLYWKPSIRQHIPTDSHAGFNNFWLRDHHFLVRNVLFLNLTAAFIIFICLEHLIQFEFSCSLTGKEPVSKLVTQAVLSLVQLPIQLFYFSHSLLAFFSPPIPFSSAELFQKSSILFTFT